MSATGIEGKILFEEASQQSEAGSSSAVDPCTQDLSLSAHHDREDEGCEISKFGDMDTKAAANLVASRLTAASLSMCDMDSKGIAPVARKQTPLLACPPGLVRRFADCDLTGDCQYLSTSDESQPELPTDGSIPGDCGEVKVLRARRSWKGRLFHSFKKSISRKSSLAIEKGEKRLSDACGEQESGGLSCYEEKLPRKRQSEGRFQPVADLFHLFHRRHLTLQRRQSFMEENVSATS